MTDDGNDGRGSVDELLEVLTLRAAGPGVRRGTSMSRPGGRVYGGQLLAQASLAAAYTPGLGPGRLLHSLHCTFLAAADPARTLEFRVTTLQDGRSFTRRRVNVAQDDRAVAEVAVSFHRPGTGFEHGGGHVLPDPPEAGAVQGQFSDPATGAWLAGPVQVTELPAPDGGPEAPTDLWVRIPGPLPDDPVLQEALLLYLSDMRMLRSLFRGHGVDRSTVRTASLDHGVWLHRRCRVDRWLCYRTHSPWAAHGRALGAGELSTPDGDRVASTAQEMLVRPRKDHG
ncbi:MULTISPECIES: acyl-CoA thioesterase domain-containing protein [unclassified Pseudonocardia]|uniref:acyl-CoA thioesterase n=1 Tax=unclassified Pseudonocardia TaxID=2619320 RepID=UPI0001FFEBBF|nr:acyl-CoA thioesterase domain-containing protein [Pseudonocardia sp. Ae707_Ps1]OLM19939.1 Acyl-CoA thioesterase II [Pseudonocardia sp. Ae707_Ps1]